MTRQKKQPGFCSTPTYCMRQGAQSCFNAVTHYPTLLVEAPSPHRGEGRGEGGHGGQTSRPLNLNPHFIDSRPPRSHYVPQEIEPKWQKIWTDRGVMKASDASPKPKFYDLVMYPYPSGELHM